MRHSMLRTSSTAAPLPWTELSVLSLLALFALLLEARAAYPLLLLVPSGFAFDEAAVPAGIGARLAFLSRSSR